MQAVDFSNIIDKAREHAIVKNAEVVGECPKHGAYTRGDLAACGIWLESQCPQCHKAVEAERKRAERLEWARGFIRERSGIPVRFQEKSFDTYSARTPQAKQALNIIRSYAESFPEHRKSGVSMILCGKTGTGKTHLVCAMIAHIAARHGQGGYYTSAYKIVSSIKACYGKNDQDERDVISSYIEPEILVVDEVGVQFGTDTEKMLLFEVINGRYEQMKPTVVVSNLSQGEIAGYLGDRVMDRLKENGGASLVFGWESHRQ